MLAVLHSQDLVVAVAENNVVITVAVIDDETEALPLLKIHLERYPHLQLIGKASDTSFRNCTFIPGKSYPTR